MMEGLGRLFDLSFGNIITNLGGGANVTGKRVSLKNSSGVTVIVFKGAGTSTQDPVLTFGQATAASGGTLTNTAPLIDHYFKKSAVAPTGGETWTKVTQTANNVVTLTGEATSNGLYALYVAAGDMVVRTDPYLEVDVGSVAAAQNLGIMFILHDLEVQRAPAKLASAQA
jgi:hypothetical protein